ncbi:MAG: hypothetical protein L0H53_07095 [Candidatus Nitrosocosmicus sp.]|nr:hypothetical protein [Candidatus Nitrosocosmicus sp.]MDN5866875.1 hypothetical protein [Candidatus Nitrosocosmicus sp.]
MSSSEITLRTPFVIQNFASIDNFIMTVFPALESYLNEKLVEGVQTSALVSMAYSKLKDSFKFFIVRNYSKDLDEYLNKEAKRADKEVMKEVLLSTISITLNINDADGHKLTENDYLISIRNIIKKIGI